MTSTLPTISDVANEPDSRATQLAVAHIIATLEASAEWNTDTLIAIRDVITPLHTAAGLPSFADAHHRAVLFWQRALAAT